MQGNYPALAPGEVVGSVLMAELSRSSGVPVATIKYYLREGLLPPGEATSATRAEYDETHLRRLQLIRALVEIGEVPVAAIDITARNRFSGTRMSPPPLVTAENVPSVGV